MKKSRLLGAVCACLSILSFNASAVVLNTLNGVDYEWLEVTATQGLSRDEVELRLADINDELYGYKYASRQLIEDLLLSYSSWDGLDGYHGEASVVAATESYFEDFGITGVSPPSDPYGDGIDHPFTTVDGYNTGFDAYAINYGFYGESSECGSESLTCIAVLALYYNAAGDIVFNYQVSKAGYNAADENPSTLGSNQSFSNYGSYLVKTSVVPVPAAVWLFSSGLLGLVGMARHKKA